MLLPLCLLLPLAQDASAPEGPTFRPMLSVRCGGAEAWFVDEKDQAFLRALQMFDDRLRELPAEVPDFDAPPQVLGLLTRLFRGPMSLSVGTSSQPIPGMPMPIVGELRLTQASSSDAQALVGDVAGFIEQMGAPMQAPPAGKGWVLPAPVPLWMGESAGDVYLRLGLEGGAPAPSYAGLLPDGATAYLDGALAYGEMLELFMGAAGGAPEMAQLEQVFRMFGLQSMNFEFAMGSDQERGYSVLRMPGWAAAARESGLLASEPLSPEVVAAIPEDATWATATSFDLGRLVESYGEMLRSISGGELDLYGLIEQETGIDVQRDLVAPFGGQMAVYASDSTGGGGMLSMVAVVRIGDRAAFDSSWERLEAAVARLGRREAMGYVRMSSFSDGAQEYDVLSFPGLPIPLELCVAATDRFMVLGVTPQAARAAVRQLSSSRSLLDNAAFQAQLPQRMTNVMSLSWVDTPRLLRDGYGTLSLMCSAVSNAMRSPRDAGREPGLLLPSYAELSEGALASVSVGRVEGDDYVQEGRSDRSQLVNAAGAIGYLYASPLGPLLIGGVGGGLVAPQVMGRQQQAEQLLALAEAEARLAELERERQMEEDLYAGIERIYAALDAFAANNGGNYPDTLAVLVARDANGNAYLDETALYDPWGDAYLYEPPAEPGDEPFVTYQE